MIQLSSGDCVEPSKACYVLARSREEGGAHVIVGTVGGPFVIVTEDLTAAEALRDTILADINGD